MESEAVMSSFHAVYDHLNQALDDLQYDELGISVEVKEQVSLLLLLLVFYFPFALVFLEDSGVIS
jgi:hypothetical protein